VSPTELARVLEEPDLRICDVRWYLGEPKRGRAEYGEGHIPGAVFVDLDTMLAARRGPGRHPLPHPVRFAATLGRLGIAPETRVIAYDTSGGSIAARMWWMLRQLGHVPVAVLDGGLTAWLATGLPLDTHVPAPPPVPYPVLMSAWPDAVDLDELRSTDATLVDARAAERYRGDTEPVDPRPGHIPGAINLPHTGNLGADGRHLSPAELAERFDGIEAPIVYCGSGVTACADILAMELAGMTGARLYPGSWSDWSSSPDLPARLGPEP
jgi:thiosulfate/3-mercaptopyruvate sulfurtransferase